MREKRTLLQNVVGTFVREKSVFVLTEDGRLWELETTPVNYDICYYWREVLMHLPIER